MKKGYIIFLVATLFVVGFLLSQSPRNGNGIVHGEAFDDSIRKSLLDSNSPTACVQPPAGLVSWYRAEGNFADAASGTTGTQTGGVAFATGKVGQAFDLNGSSGTVTVGNPANLQLTTGMTAEAWVRPDITFTDYKTVVSKWSQAQSSSWGLYVNTNRVYGILWGSNNQFVDAVGGDIPFGTTAAFTHIAMTYSAPDGLRVYVNGVQVDSDISVGNLRSGSDVVRIGNDRDLIPNRFFDGLIDEPSVYNRALTPAELLSIYNAGIDGKCVGPPVTPSPTPTPVCNFTVSPKNATYDGLGTNNAVMHVDTQAGCSWGIVFYSDWLTIPTIEAEGVGPRDVHYSVPTFSGDFRSGFMEVSLISNPFIGAVHNISQQGLGRCPIGNLITAIPSHRPDSSGSLPSEEADSVLSPFYGFRDEVLAKSERGKKYTDDYYSYAGEITRLMIFNPSLFFRSKDVLDRYQPVVESVLRRERARAEGELTGRPANLSDLEPTLVYDDEIDDVTDLLASFSDKASVSLKETLEGIQRDIRDPQVQAEFGVRIAYGEKRPFPDDRLTTASRFRDMPLFDLGSRLKFFDLFSSPAPIREATQQTETAQKDPLAKRDLYGHIPLSFEANQGQVDAAVKYLSRGPGYNLFLTASEAVLSLPVKTQNEKRNEFDDPDLISRLSDVKAQLAPAALATLRMRLDAANAAPRVKGHDELPGKSNYFIGNDSRNWRSRIPNYSKVRYEKVYAGVDLVYYGNQRQLEYDFHVAPGADPSQIKMKFEGADELVIDASGDLLLKTAAGTVKMHQPVTYQEINGSRREIASSYSIAKDSQASNSYTVGFDIEGYDKTKPLVIDPVLVYSTYLGGSGNDDASGIAVDAAGNAYVIGFTDSTNFPISGAMQPTYGGNPQDIFVSKLNAAGTALVYSTYLGGSGQDNGSDIAVDAAGNAYITGYSGSTNFPVANALQPTRTGLYNAFVAKLNPTGSQLVYSTYYGGTTGEYGSSIAVDPSGNAYVGGVTSSANFPDTAGVIQTNFGGSLADGFVTKFNAAGNQVLYSTFLGGNGNDGVTSIAIDPAGNAYVTGVTFSTNFPTATPLQATFLGGVFDAFVTKLNPTGTAMGYSTYLGGTDEDRGFRVELDAAGNAYVAGMTLSTNFPVVSALQPAIGGGSDAFVTKLTPGGAISYSTFLGGSGLDGATGLSVNPAGTVFLTGFTTSPNFPLAAASQATYGGGEFDAFAAKINATGGSLNYSTYIGGASYDTGFDVTADSAGNAFVLGRTSSVNFPLVNPLQPTNGGQFDVFVTKLSANVTISGRVTTPTGLGLRNANVVLTDSLGVRRIATTSSFGIYSFADVRTGENLIIGVSSKRYRFAPQSLVVNGNLANVDFVGLE